MDGDDRRLDGNAAAGLLQEVFPFEMTMVQSLCSGCGAMDRVAEVAVYVDAPGMVLRCPHCDNVLLRIVRAPGRYWLEMRGVACLQIQASA